MFIEWNSLLPSLLLAGNDATSSRPTFGFGLDRRADTQTSFPVYQPSSLDNVAGVLGEACTKALYANVTCHGFVRNFLRPGYRGSPGDKQLADSICTNECQWSLKDWFTSVSSSCATKTLHDAVPQRLGGFLYEGWNETCVRDPKTKEYCNDIINNFTVVSNVTQMPRNELCSTCYVRKLAMMQASSYSVYNQFYKANLEYVYAQCGGKGSTEIPPSPDIPPPPPTEAWCVSGTRYATKQGDTCDSIASGANLSAAALYMGNQDLVRDCKKVTPGLSLCLPLPCTTYRVQPNDTCTKIEAALGLMWGSIRNYNAWINSACVNLQSGTDFYGKTICAGPQGGRFTGVPTSPSVPTSTPGGGGTGPGDGKGGGSDGFYRNPVPPPSGVPVAKGTTMNCGKWHVVAASGEDCGSISIQEGIEFNLFVRVNPSLSVEGCSARLVSGTAVCVGPTPGWESGNPVLGTTATASSKTTPSTSISSTKPGTTTMKGTTSTKPTTSTKKV